MQGPFRVLVLGDCVGRPGRRALREGLPELRQRLGIDFVVANVENAVNGFGLNPKTAQEILTYPVDAMSSGDHIRDRREIDPFLASEPRLLRPFNYKDMPGSGATVLTGPRGVCVGLINVSGLAFMDDFGNPLALADEALAAVSGADVVLVDVHGEATAEKVALGWYLDGRVSAVYGTHTHVQTADETILPKGTGYITDIGFVGAHKSVLGREVDRVLNRMLGKPKSYMEVASDWLRLDGTLFELDPATSRCLAVTRVQHRVGEWL